MTPEETTFPQIDLHIHSTASDGSVPPEELPRLAAEAGLVAAALTDHDTVAGIPAFFRAAEAYPGLEAIAGVELSTVYCSREMHIVGLFIDPASPELNAFLERQRLERMERSELIRSRLASLGYPLTREELELAGGGDGTTGRPHFARALINKYHFTEMNEVFDKLLKHGAAGFVPRKLPLPTEAFAAIHAAGGITVWAHPVYRQRNERAFARRMMRKFSALGLDAAEGYYSLFGPGETLIVTEIAAEFGLAVSGGSDFHGDNTPNLKVGCGAGKMRVPAALLDGLREKRKKILSGN